MPHSDAHSSRTAPPIKPLTAAAPPADDRPSWVQLERRALVRRRLISVAVVVALLLAALVALVWNASGRYASGKQALQEGRYGEAVADFTAARVLFFSYRDADSLRQQAQAKLADAADTAASERRRRESVARLLATADERLANGAYASVVAALEEMRKIAPEDPLPLDAAATKALTQLAERLRDGSSGALAQARWLAARLQADALLLLLPGDAQATRLAERADEGTTLQKRLDAARAAARDGEWRRALRLARAVLAEKAGFPGAAQLVAEARAALAPKPTATPTPTPSPTTRPSTPQPTLPPPP
jgi:hypothetical protein